MFTGIIEGIGRIRRLRTEGHGKRLTVEAGFALEDSRTGDSIAVNGACLTAVRIEGVVFEADLSPETLATTTLGKVAPGQRVNLERALRLSDRLDGHLVAGHVDGIGALLRRWRERNAILLQFRAPPELARFLIYKGSVAVDGVSLTVNRCEKNEFTVSVIPHTAAETTLGEKNPGDLANIETDMIGKYVERLLNADGAARSEGSGKSGVDMAFLAKTGFLNP